MCVTVHKMSILAVRQLSSRDLGEEINIVLLSVSRFKLENLLVTSNCSGLTQGHRSHIISWIIRAQGLLWNALCIFLVVLILTACLVFQALSRNYRQNSIVTFWDWSNNSSTFPTQCQQLFTIHSLNINRPFVKCKHRTKLQRNLILCVRFV